MRVATASDAAVLLSSPRRRSRRRRRGLRSAAAMGLDGGTIVTRTDVLRGSSWRLANQDDGRQRSTRGGQLTATGALLRDAVADRDAAYNRWSCCALSGRSLVAPGTHVVADQLGQLFERNAVVEFLTSTGQFGSEYCDRAALTATLGHIARLRDVFAVTLTRAHGDAAAKAEGAPWCCAVDPATETNGRHVRRAHAVRPRRRRAGVEGGGRRRACPVCSAAAAAAVALFSAAETAARRKAELDAAKAERAARKAKKRARPRDDGGGGN